MFKQSLLLCLITISNLVYAGNGTSGGGGAFVCRDNQRNILNSELLDLWEAHYLDQLTIVRSNESVEVQSKRAIAKLDKLHTPYGDKIRAELALILRDATALSSEIELPAPHDAKTNYQKPGCPLEGMMFYDGDFGHVVYNLETYNHLLSNTDKAAVWVHEAIYKILRDVFRESDSIHARKLVGCLFSKECSFDNAHLMTINELLQNDSSPLKFKCEDAESTIYVTGYRDSTSNIRFNGFHANHSYFTKLDNLELKYPAYELNYNYSNGGWSGGLIFQGGLEKYGLFFAEGSYLQDGHDLGGYSNYFFNWVNSVPTNTINAYYTYNYNNPDSPFGRKIEECSQIK